MTHTQYESYMTHLEDLVVLLFFLFFNNQTQSSTEWNHHSNLGRWIICSNFATQLYSDSQKETPDGRPQRTEVYWESQSGLVISRWADVSACNFIQLRSIYLSHNVNTDVEQRRGEMNSPAPQHTHYIVSNTHILNDTEIHMRIHTHMLWHEFVYPARSRPAYAPRSPSSFDVWKVEGNQSHFLHSGRCGLWFPGAGGARLAVKYCRACRVWEVYGAPRVAKNNRGNCWSKAPTAGTEQEGGPRTETSTPRSCILSSSVTREPLLLSSLT